MSSSERVNGLPENEPEQQGQDSKVLTGIVCNTCRSMNEPDAAACHKCGRPLQITSQKVQQDNPEDASHPLTENESGAYQEHILLEIEDKELNVPLADVLIVGREIPTSGGRQPDLDLNPYGAAEKGISRRHIKIRRKNILLYVTDLGSTNGTFLNGIRLIPHVEHVLRNGDRLQLGKLKLRMKFQ